MRIVLLGKAAAGSCACAATLKSSDASSALLMSIELRAGGLHDLRPAREVGLDLGGEFLGRVGDRVDAVPVQALEEIRATDDRDRIVVHLLHDLARRSRR